VWEQRARRKEFDQVVAPLTVFVPHEDHPEGYVSNPRETESYRTQLLEELGLGDTPDAKYGHLSEDEIGLVRQVVRRKSGALWVDGSPRTLVRGFTHHMVVNGGPVNQPPHRLKGEDLAFVEESLEKQEKQGLVTRGRSEWGSAAFSTKPGKRKRRVVIDYRAVNAVTVKSPFHLPRSDDTKARMAGGCLYTAADAVAGFNHVRNTREARLILAISCSSGKYLPETLVFGPTNGPEDFQLILHARGIR